MCVHNAIKMELKVVQQIPVVVHANWDIMEHIVKINVHNVILIFLMDLKAVMQPVVLVNLDLLLKVVVENVKRDTTKKQILIESFVVLYMDLILS